jgi:hypothetical protein
VPGRGNSTTEIDEFLTNDKLKSKVMRTYYVYEKIKENLKQRKVKGSC